MNSKYQSVEILTRVQKEKYKYLIIPIVMVFASLLLKYVGVDILYSRILSVIGFLDYIILLRMLRVSRIGDDHADNTIYAPIYGVVTKVEKNADFTKIRIKKNIFKPIDIRTTSAGDVFDQQKQEVINKSTNVSWNVISGKIKILDPATQRSVGFLFGIIPLMAEVEMNIPAKYNVMINENQNLESGETEIGRLNES